MNKKGQEYVQSETIEYMLIVAIGVTVALMLFTSLKLEKYNAIRAEDLALTLNSAFIPKGDLNVEYDMGDVERQIIFEDGKIKTYIDDPIRERSGLLLLDENYVFRSNDAKTSRLGIVKEKDKVDVA